jgi:ribosomal protein L23
MGKEKAGLTLKKNRFAEIEEITRKFGFEIDPKKKVYNMAVSEKQTLEIIKVLYYGAKVIILDEPTAVLTVQEIEKLFGVHVLKVNTMWVKAKNKRVRYQMGKTRTWKKAVVTLAAGEQIEVFAPQSVED